MKERRLKNQMTWATSILIILIVCVVVGGSVMVNVLRNIQNESRKITMLSRITEYKLKVDNKIESDFELLNSIAPFLSNVDSVGVEDIGQVLLRSQENSSFVRIGYYDKKDSMIKVSAENKVQDGVFINLFPEVQKIVKKSLEGEQSISKLYIDVDYKEPFIALSVPIYNDDEIVGALIGSYPLQDLKELLNYASYKDGDQENVDLIDAEGNLLVHSGKSVIDISDDTNLYEFGTYSNKDLQIIKEKTGNKETFQVDFTYNGETYPSMFMPIDSVDWYLIYTDSTNAVLNQFYNNIKSSQIYLSIILVIVLIANMWFYKNMAKGKKELEQLAYYDQLTHSYNFSKFKEEVNNRQGKIKAIAVLNVRKFQYVNKMFGRKNGDELLYNIAKIIKRYLTPDEFYCRENSDQFFIALGTDQKEIVEERFLNIIKSIERSSEVLYHGYQVQVLIGAAILTDDVQNCIERSIFALKEGRKEKGSQIAFWSEIMKQFSDTRFYVDSHKHEALEQEEFQLYVQPKKNLKTGLFDTAEVLVRWIKPDGTMIFPDQFIPDFEESGFCVDLDIYMFTKTCQTIRKWMDEGKEVVGLSVNQSKLLFYQDNYVELLCEISDRYGVPRHLLTLEILENLAMDDGDEMNQIVKALRRKGFRISIDDFGSGYSSLNVLGNLQVDELKLDRIFLKKTMEEEKNKIIIRHITEIAKEMGVSIVVEGVETKEDEEFIKTTNADFGQGYCYSRPIPLAEFEKKYIHKKGE